MTSDAHSPHNVHRNTRRCEGKPTSDVGGLTTCEAEDRLAREGPNVLPVRAGTPLWRQLLRQLFNFFAVMLWIAGALAMIARLTALGVAIFGVIVANAVFAFWQEYRAEKAAHHLRALLPRKVTVVRDGSAAEVDADRIVVDDLVVLTAGDRVPADMNLREAHGLLIDTSTLTGESVPEAVAAGDPAYSGTFVVEGEGRATVTAIGVDTRLADIAELTQAGRRPLGPLAIELHHLVRVIATVAVVVGVGFFGLALLVGTPPSEGLIFGIGVTVALVPEGLLPTVTLSLAIGAQRMARDARPGPPPGIRGDPGIDDLHLHGQDRHAHVQRDGGGRGLDARQARPRSVARVRADRGDPATRSRTSRRRPPARSLRSRLAMLGRAGRGGGRNMGAEG